MIEINPNLVLVDYQKPETWRNSPPPMDVSAIQAELTRIGGTVPDGYGENSGKPNFEIVWGQSYKTWINGKMRLMFDDENIDAKHFPNHFAVTDEVYQRAITWYLGAEKKRQDALMRCDWAGAQNFPDFAQYLESKESSLNYFPLPKEADPRQIASLIPDGYKYLCGLYSYEEIGKQTFFVVQWESPEMLGSEETWNDLRYDWGYYPETDTDQNFIDVLGPYPRNGQWSLPVLRIGDRVSPNEFIYRIPTIDNVIIPMQQLLRIRERLSKYEKSADFQQELRVNEFRRKVIAQKEEFHYRFKQAKPVGGGNPTNVPTIKVRPGINKQGKGKVIL